jgi:homoserine O-acetyltransferase
MAAACPQSTAARTTAAPVRPSGGRVMAPPAALRPRSVRGALAFFLALLLALAPACARHGLRRDRAPDVFRLRFETTQGSFVVESRREWAPHGADRLFALTRAGFFDDSRFFRVRAGFIAQFGIPGDPTVAARWRAATIPDDPVRRSNTRGTVSYAMTGPGTRTTQLFINLADNRRLDAEGFAPIGTVVEGMEVVERLYAGYGEAAGGGMRGGRQGPLFEGGNAYLDGAYPRLDRLLRVRHVGVRR